MGFAYVKAPPKCAWDLQIDQNAPEKFILSWPAQNETKNSE